MQFTKTGFPGLILVEPSVFGDNRGYFFESYNEREFLSGGIGNRFVQDNQSRSSIGVIRGLHYQRPPFAQAKLVRVLSGAIVDVAVDIRAGSPTFGRSYSIELSADNKRQLFIPPGFAHGFAVISAVADVLYKCDAYYNRESERGFHYDDPHFSIDWRVPADTAVVSEKDKLLPLFDTYAGEFTYSPQP